MVFGTAITQEQFIAWATAAATAIATVGGALEFVIKRLYRAYVEEHGKLSTTERAAYVALQSQMEATRQEVIIWRTLAEEKLAAVGTLTKLNAHVPEDLSGRVLQLINELRILHTELPVPGICFPPAGQDFAPNTRITYATQDVSPTATFPPGDAKPAS